MFENKKITLTRNIGTLGLTASIFNCTVGGGIFRLPGIVYKLSGAAAPLVYGICAVLIFMIGYCFSLLGKNTLKTGGPYAYVQTTFGNYPGYVAAILGWMLGTFALASVMNAFLNSLTSVFSTQNAFVLKGGLTFCLLSLLVGLSLLSTKLNARLLIGVTCFKLIPLFLFAAISILYFDPDSLNLSPSVDVSVLSRSSMMLIFAYMGIESALAPSGEIIRPNRTVPISLFISLGLVATLYMVVQLGCSSILGAGLLEHQETPIMDAAYKILGNPGKWLMLLGASVSMLGFMMSMMFCLPRIPYELAQDGILPNKLTYVSDKHRAPSVAIVVQGILLLCLVSTGSFETLAILANLSAIVLYILCISASWVMVRREKKRRRLHSSLTQLIIFSTLATMAWMLTSVTSKEWAGFIALLALSSALYYVRKRHVRSDEKAGESIPRKSAL